MLKRDVAQQLLQKTRDPDWKTNIRARVAGLAGVARAAGMAWFAEEVDSADVEEHLRLEALRQAAFDQACLTIDEMGKEEQFSLWTAVFGKLAAFVDKTWRRILTGPYGGRGQFRAPNHPQVFGAQRRHFLKILPEVISGYPEDPAWLAAWAGYLRGRSGRLFHCFLASVIDTGSEAGDRVFDTLASSARGEHEVGSMGDHVLRPLLSASRADGWEIVEKMLLAAQREEGLRQSILESAHGAHPEAFRRMLRLILEHGLCRFSATVRAVDVWFGYGLDADSSRKAEQVIETVLGLLDDELTLKRAIAGPDPEATYLALWVIASRDAFRALEEAAPLLTDVRVERRLVAAKLLRDLELPEAHIAILPLLEDADLRVASCALQAISGNGWGTHFRKGVQESDAFERLERLIARFPKKPSPQKPLVWPWFTGCATRSHLGLALLRTAGTRPIQRLLRHKDSMDTSYRGELANRLALSDDRSPDARKALLSFISDISVNVRSAALTALNNHTIEPGDAPTIESLLQRKPGDLRRAALGLLLRQTDEDALASADRLLASPSTPQQSAGTELLRLLCEAGRAREECRKRAQAHRTRSKVPSVEKATHLNVVLATPRAAPTMEDALGLLDMTRRTRPAAPRDRGTVFVTPASVRLLEALDLWIDERRDVEVRVGTEGYPQERLLGSLERWLFPKPSPERPIEEDLARLLLKDPFLEWLRARPAETRDQDGREVLRAALPRLDSSRNIDWDEQVQRRLIVAHLPPPRLKHEALVGGYLSWLLRIEPPRESPAFLLEAFETTLALTLGSRDNPPLTRIHAVPCQAWVGMLRQHHALHRGAWSDGLTARIFLLLRWIEEAECAARLRQDPTTTRRVIQHRLELDEFLPAWRKGVATEADFIALVMGERAAPSEYDYGWGCFGLLGKYSTRKQPQDLSGAPVLLDALDRCRRRILDVELARGDAATEASNATLSLCYSGGLDIVLRTLEALGRVEISRNDSGRSRGATFAHVLRASRPAEDEPPETFSTRAKAIGILPERLLELAVFAPQWAAHVEHALGWVGLNDAIWWLHAHTKDAHWSVQGEIREAWKVETSERTPLSSIDLTEGAVDVEWFRRAHDGLGAKRWKSLHEAARFASSGSGHARAQLWARAMLGQVSEHELCVRMRRTRNQDAVRALGLIPLPAGARRAPALLRRYRMLRDFVRTSRAFGAQRQASEKRAARLGMENLARNAGFPDPLRLEWAMEAEAIADLASGPIVRKHKDVEVVLALDADGLPELSVARGGRPLATVPAEARKAKPIAELLERRTELRQQASGIRGSLEDAMCRGDAFTGAELCELFRHPILAPLLGRLILTGGDVAGYPANGGRALVDYAGGRHSIRSTHQVKIAHTHDLFARGDWSDWQRECFSRERVQPFKQVFRELYVLTKAERASSPASRRYAGHQVQPGKALALFGKRGWMCRREEGLRRTFHHAGISAWLTVQEPFHTPAEIEGLTLEAVRFSSRTDPWKPIPLTQVPAAVFSETMRDLDLVVSVAHRGGVDPEASASTVEMRATLLRETCALLRLGNVRIRGSHAFIAGKLADYSVHLGSAVAHCQPGTMLFLVAVHGQHRGRLFLPFADDDPKTAEALSKVIYLARDGEIRDPSLLEQIRGV